jgi:hypothetical protein
MTAIHLCVLRDNSSAFDRLLRAGADPDIADAAGTTPLLAAVRLAERWLANGRVTVSSDDMKIARDFLGDDFVDHFAATREWEHRQWQDAVTDWELKRYFEII